ncbi:MAG: hypothetical protein ICV59_03015 [Thermoleophilia bacterium]|nr:hypothetical protein [Thermoleophilia bacterium]
MSAQTFWSRRTLYRWAPYVAGSVLAVGVVAFLVAFYGNTAPDSTPEIQRTGPAIVDEPTGKKAPVSRGVQAVAARFIKTAVARRNLDVGWKLTHPELRAGTTYKEWLRGESTVVPYPVDLGAAPPFRVDESYERRVELEVVLTPRKGSGVKSQIFFIGLKAVGQRKNKRWLVYYWAPRSTPPIPANPQ